MKAAVRQVDSKKPTFEPILPTASLRAVQYEALRRLTMLHYARGKRWVPIADFYNACGSIGLCSTERFESFVMECAVYGLFQTKRKRQQNGLWLYSHVAPAVVLEEVRFA